MISDWTLILFLSAFIWLAAASAKGVDRAFLLIFAFSQLFYCVLGVWFWTVGRLGLFVGFYWPIEQLYRTDLYFTASNAALALMVLLLSRSTKPLTAHGYSIGTPEVPSPFPRGVFWTFLGIGMLSSMFVLSKGSFGSGGDRGGFFLIAYQFSDVLIPVTCFYVARRGFNLFSLALIAYFLFFASLVGFRYKIALLAMPLMFFVLYSDFTAKKKLTIVGASGVFVMLLFSFLTLFRVKFGVPDLSKPLDQVGGSLLYGFFAEANTIFGMTAVQQWFVEGGIHYGLQPLIDAFLELIPRFLMPGRVTGEYLTQLQYGMVSEQGARSGTAYYWVGEFCIMFGWLGYYIGPIIMLGIYTAFRMLFAKLRPRRAEVALGCFIAFTTLGYYQFGRGYFPQIMKSYIFVVLPFFLLGIAHRLRFGSR